MYEHIAGCQVKGLTSIYMSQFGYKAKGYFVEIGAFNCLNWSNSHCLALAGWAGLLIEPQELYFNDCQELYRGNDKIILEQCCIGKENGKVDLYLGGSTSTIKEETIEIYNDSESLKFGGLDVERFIERDLFTLDFMLDKHSVPKGFEVLIVDVEGAEVDVLAGFSLDKWVPQLVIIEAHEQNENEQLREKAIEINEYFADYEKIYSDHINNIYIKGNTQ